MFQMYGISYAPLGQTERRGLYSPGSSAQPRVQLSGGSLLCVRGQVRSHNLRENGRRRLLIFVFASHIVCEDGAPINEVSLEGTLCREPIYRRTPLGREICDVMLAVPRAFHRADYLPCILWGKVAAQ